MNFGMLTTQQSHGIKNTIFHQRKKKEHHQARSTKYLHSMAFVMFHGVSVYNSIGGFGVLCRYYFGCFFSNVAWDQIVIETCDVNQLKETSVTLWNRTW
jgi:hypothetical protein